MDIRGIQLAGKWADSEVKELELIFKPLPRAFVELNPSFKTIERQSMLTDAPPSAPGHSKYEPESGTIVVFDKGVYHGRTIDPEQFRRSVYHELAHAIVRSTPSLLDRWRAETSGDGFVDEYAKTNDEEDFCDTFSESLIHGDRVAKAVPHKAAFVRKLLARASFE
jgi:hypothetical protein